MRKGVFPAVALFLVLALSPRFLIWTLSRLFPLTGAPTPQPQGRLSPPIGAPTPPTTTSTP